MAIYDQKCKLSKRTIRQISLALLTGSGNWTMRAFSRSTALFNHRPVHLYCLYYETVCNMKGSACHVGHYGTHLITEVRQLWSRIMLGWVTELQVCRVLLEGIPSSWCLGLKACKRHPQGNQYKYV
jgi:hypothetical protein